MKLLTKRIFACTRTNISQWAVQRDVFGNIFRDVISQCRIDGLISATPNFNRCHRIEYRLHIWSVRTSKFLRSFLTLNAKLRVGALILWIKSSHTELSNNSDPMNNSNVRISSVDNNRQIFTLCTPTVIPHVQFFSKNYFRDSKQTHF